MANLYGRMQGSRGMTTRCGSSSIWAELATWNGSIQTELDKDGTFRVYIGPKYNANILIVEGNVNDGERNAMGKFVNGGETWLLLPGTRP